jgi:hypothetical protein
VVDRRKHQGITSPTNVFIPEFERSERTENLHQKLTTEKAAERAALALRAEV